MLKVKTNSSEQESFVLIKHKLSELLKQAELKWCQFGLLSSGVKWFGVFTYRLNMLPELKKMQK